MGKLFDIILLALHSLSVHLVRSALTMLGIVFGVCSVTAMLAIQTGASKESQEKLSVLGSNNVIMNSIEPAQETTRDGGGHHGMSMKKFGITYKDLKCIVENVPGVLDYATVHNVKVRYYCPEDRNRLSLVMGVTPNYADILNLRISSGRFISAVDMLHMKPYCVITQTLARTAFKCLNPVGRTLKLKGQPFEIIGVIDYIPSKLGISEEDIPVFIPKTTKEGKFGQVNVNWYDGKMTSEDVQVDQLILKMKDESTVLTGAPVVRSIMEKNHDKLEYAIMIPLKLIQAKAAQQRIWDMIFFAIASISLIVGGIGIMNIMLASVTERTREIGVRRALGAKKRDIIIQFLFEAMTMTTLGGLIGVIIGYFVPPLLKDVVNVTPIVSVPMLIGPFLMAVAVGVISGLYPARRAAALDPIEALRHE
ncbi:MAG: FtsX-like permease family protein [Phycisphaerales bacterium]|nr:FtsX-like permease family protein [Phycisphaerales bacterium]